jgi:hypothetical protein
MISYNQEYFKNNCYFFLKDKGENISLYYSIADTISESRKKDEKKEFKKKDANKVKKVMDKFLNKKTKPNKKELEKDLKDVEELDELVDSDGTFTNSKVPFLNMLNHPRKTRGYRVYWGESEDEQDNVVSEVDYSDAFGYEETENMDFKNTVKTLKDMGVDNPKHRAKEFGKLPKAKRKGGKLKQRLSEKTIEEQQKDMMSSLLEKIVSENSNIDEEQKRAMEKMVEDILSKRDRNDSDVVSKNSGLNKILLKNIKSIKKLAEKEGISINQLIKALKTNE